MTPADRTTPQRLSPFVIALGAAMIVVATVGVLAGGGGSDGETSAVERDPASSESPSTPPIPTAAATTTPLPTPPPTAPPETPQAFFTLLGRAFASNDDAFLFDRLHPLVLTRYGAEQCRAYFAGQNVPNFAVEVVAVRAVEPWDWALDGRTDRLPAAVPVQVRIADDGTTFREVESHLVLVGNQLRWFTDCGTPV